MVDSFRVGECVVEPQLNRIRCGQKTARIEAKAMDVLVYLAGHPNEVLPKERIIQAVWPDVSVTDDVLTHAISELRKAFEDDARGARFIETIPRRGYRLIAPVELNVPNDPEQPAEDTGRARSVDRGKGFSWWWAGVVAVILLGIAWLWIVREGGPVEQTLPQRSALTSLAGSERSPVFSPNGHHVAFSWNGPGQDNWDIYVQMIDTRELTRRTNDPADDFNPAWSSDGRYIAFGRSDGETGRLILIPEHGGREQVLVTMPNVRRPRVWSDSRYFTSGWGPDGKWLISSIPNETSVGLVRLSVGTSERRQLTAPSEGIWDLQPAVSPDGRSIVFIRELVWTTKDLYLLRLSETGEPRGEPQRLTFENDRLFSPVWSADGRSVLYSYAGHLWQIDAGKPGKGIQLMSWGEPNANPDFDVSYRANRLVFEQGGLDLNIYRIERSDSGVFGRPGKLIASTRDDRGGEYSPDGQKIAFSSARSGFWEVYVCDRDGRNEFPLTNFSGPIGGAPAWSRDGSRIAYDSRVEGPSHIYVTSSTGGQATKLTKNQDTMPYWSRDGNWIYYTGGYAGRARALWKIPAGGGGAVFVVDDGIRGKEDYHGRFLYYWKGAGSRSAPDRSGGIWRMPIKGGKEEFFLDTIDVPWGCFDVVKDGIFFFSEQSSSGSSFLSFHSFASGKVEPVVEVARPASSLSATSDGRSVLFTQMDQERYDLILLENFHGIGEGRESKQARRSSANIKEMQSK